MYIKLYINYRTGGGLQNGLFYCWIQGGREGGGARESSIGREGEQERAV